MTDMTGYDPKQPAAYRWGMDLPGFYHKNACGFSFADGHSEIKKWQDGRTIVSGNSYSAQTYNPINRDVMWLQERTSARVQ